MDPALLLIIAAVVVVVAFDFTNGFNDAPNMIGTLVGSRAMPPAQAAALVAVFTLLGPILGGTAVADTIGGFVDIGDLAELDALRVVACGVFGAIGWNITSWRLALPSSSSHALVGGLVGAVLVGAGSGHVSWGFAGLTRSEFSGVAKIVVTLFTSPLIGFVLGFGIHRCARLMLRGATPKAARTLRRMQWVTAAALAFAHGTNDAQKGMGIITLMLVLSGHLDEFTVPLWVIALATVSITLGTLSGGWRIVRTVGFGIYKLRVLHGFDSQLTSSSVILSASLIGGPVSTTHVVNSSIMGIGASERPRAVRWSTAREIVAAWLLTMPGAAAFATLAYWLTKIVG